jgi:hypothetical protein
VLQICQVMIQDGATVVGGLEAIGIPRAHRAMTSVLEIKLL